MLAADPQDYDQLSCQVLLESTIDFESLVYKRHFPHKYHVEKYHPGWLCVMEWKPDLVLLSGTLFEHTRDDAVAYKASPFFFLKYVYYLSYIGLIFPLTAISGSTRIVRAILRPYKRINSSVRLASRTIVMHETPLDPSKFYCQGIKFKKGYIWRSTPLFS